jgi:hypothetical protein
VLTLDESARLAGGYAWIELRLFEIVGRWVTGVDQAEAKVLLATHARHHAERAEQWLELRPVVAGRDPDELVAAPGAGAKAALDVLADLGSGDASGLERAAGLYRVVVPRLVTAYGRHRHAATAVADGPVRRALRLVLTDLVADWQDGEALVQQLVRSPADATRAAEAQAAVESALSADGLIAPPA